MLLLAFDTATPAVTVAVHDGSAVLAEHTDVDPRRHGELLAPAIETVLAGAGAHRRQVTDVAVGVGPGPFTGLRVGLVTAGTLARVLGVRVHGVCTLDVIAADAQAERELLVATDARRKEVYWARYADRVTPLTEPAVSFPAELPEDLPVAGEGAARYPELEDRHIGPDYPSAGTLARLVATGGARLRPAEPLYLRRPDAAPPGLPKRVS